MEYFNFTAMWEKFLATDDGELSSLEQMGKDLYKDIYPNWCKVIDGKVPKDVAETLLKEFDDDYTIFVHETGRVSKERIFEEGLEIASGNRLRKTAWEYSNYINEKTDFFTEIVDTLQYKNSKRAIILKVPNSSLYYEPGKSKPILKKTEKMAMDAQAGVVGEKQTVLMPEYILGSVEFEDGQITTFEKNPNYKEIHDYSNDGLACEGELIENCKDYYKSGIDAKVIPPSFEDKDIENFINRENNQYQQQQANVRSAEAIKQYSKKGLLFSKFNEMVSKIKNFFTRDKIKEESSQDVDRK